MKNYGRKRYMNVYNLNFSPVMRWDYSSNWNCRAGVTRISVEILLKFLKLKSSYLQCALKVHGIEYIIAVIFENVTGLELGPGDLYLNKKYIMCYDMSSTDYNFLIIQYSFSLCQSLIAFNQIQYLDRKKGASWPLSSFKFNHRGKWTNYSPVIGNCIFHSLSVPCTYNHREKYTQNSWSTDVLEIIAVYVILKTQPQNTYDVFTYMHNSNHKNRFEQCKSYNTFLNFEKGSVWKERFNLVSYCLTKELNCSFSTAYSKYIHSSLDTDSTYTISYDSPLRRKRTVHNCQHSINSRFNRFSVSIRLIIIFDGYL